MASYDRDFRGLDRWKALQAKPSIGSETAAPAGGRDAVSGPVGQQYRRQQEDYGRALRLLRRQAQRDNDSEAALAMIDVRDKANAAGFSPGGIRQRDEFNAGIQGRAAALEQGARDRERKSLLDRRLVDEELEALDAAPGSSIAGTSRPVYSRAAGASPWWNRGLRRPTSRL